MKRERQPARHCPMCGQIYHSVPALSRLDNRTLICSDCGIRQAMMALGVSAEEAEKIVQIVHSRGPSADQTE